MLTNTEETKDTVTRQIALKLCRDLHNFPTVMSLNFVSQLNRKSFQPRWTLKN